MAGPDDAKARPPGRVLIAGVSTRAAAESAARAGYSVTALDAFGDRDQHGDVRGLALPRDFGVRFSARAAARAARSVECDAVVYLSTFENHPAAVRSIAAGRALWGNDPEVLARVRDPALVAAALRRRGFPAPAVRDGPDTPHAEPPNGDARPAMPNDASDGASKAQRHWLVKPRASGGGHGVRPWRRATPVPRGCYLQERIDGTPGSVVFAADGRQAVVLGVSRQLVGDAAFGAIGLRYCGSILAGRGDSQLAHDDALVEAALAVAGAVTEEFGLIGVNGVDFIARDGVPHAIEVNPRYSASMELVERAYGMSVFGVHATACAERSLPGFDVVRARRGAHAEGKAVVFARRDVRVGDTDAWLADPSVRDVPHAGEHIPAGGPVCTVFAEGSDSSRCYAALVRRAEHVHGALRAWERGVA